VLVVVTQQQLPSPVKCLSCPTQPCAERSWCHRLLLLLVLLLSCQQSYWFCCCLLPASCQGTLGSLLLLLLLLLMQEKNFLLCLQTWQSGCCRPWDCPQFCCLNRQITSNVMHL
jgi:hypothetical protein